MLLLILLGIGACHRPTYVPDETPKLPCRVTGACDATVIKYLRHFHKSGIKVVTMGQNYMIALPANILFEEQSPKIKWSAYHALNEVAGFLKQFRKIAINVTGYSSKYRSNQRERALTLARTRIVGEYLWSQGIDSRFVFTEGLGSDKPIATMLHGGDKSPNARIEITFRDAVA